MRTLTALFAVGVFALLVQGTLATLLEAPWCPDLGLLVVIAIGLRWRQPATGLVLAAGLGFAADLLSGSLFGQHALLRIVVFSSAFLAGRQLNLRGSLPLVVFAISVSFLYGVAVYLVSSFFVGAGDPGLAWALDGVKHALVNGVFATGVFSIVTRVAVWAGDDDVSTRTLRIDPRRRTI
jgi:rod shape-determining protein MreD